MAVRYVPTVDVSLRDKYNRKLIFHANHIRRDGTQGYTTEELHGLTRDHMNLFRVIEVSGDEIVEQATRAPGEKRARKPSARSAEPTE